MALPRITDKKTQISEHTLKAIFGKQQAMGVILEIRRRLLRSLPKSTWQPNSSNCLFFGTPTNAAPGQLTHVRFTTFWVEFGLIFHELFSVYWFLLPALEWTNSQSERDAGSSRTNVWWHFLLIIYSIWSAIKCTIIFWTDNGSCKNAVIGLEKRRWWSSDWWIGGLVVKFSKPGFFEID